MMQFYRALLVAFSIFLSLNHSYSQKIDIRDFNIQYLEYLIKTGIDSLRQIEDLKPLHNDSILYLAASDHASYMLGTNVLEHEQKDIPEREGPHDRINYYGGNFSMTAENIAFTHIYIPVGSGRSTGGSNIINDYKSLASWFVEGWKNSPGHYRNIVTSEFNITGVTVSYNPLTQIIFGVQKFGLDDSLDPQAEVSDKIPELDFTFVETYTKPEPHRRHAWKIKSGEKIKEIDQRRYNVLKKRLFRNTTLSTLGTNIYVTLCPLRSVRQVFINKRDGLALEFVPLSDYMNDSIFYSKPSLRNNACIFNGYVIKPIYRNEILKITQEQMESRKPRNLFIELGEIPGLLKGQQYQVNLLVLHKNRIIDRIHFENQSVGLLPFQAHADTIPIPEYHVLTDEATITWQPKIDTLFNQIFFDRNETLVDTLQIPVILENLRDPNKKLVSCNIFAFASVEGTEDINRGLYSLRAESILDIIRKEHPVQVTAQVSTRENWSMFRFQIKNTEYSYLADSSEAFIRDYLTSEKVLASIGKELDRQRYVSVYMIFEEIKSEENQIMQILNDYRNTVRYHEERIKRDNTQRIRIYQDDKYKSIERYTFRKPSKPYIIPAREIDKMLSQQRYLFKQVVEGKIPFSMIDTIPFYEVATYDKLNNGKSNIIANDFMLFKLANDPNLNPQTKYDALRFIALMDISDPLVAINYFILTIDTNYHDLKFNADQIKHTGFKVPKSKDYIFWQRLNMIITKMEKNHDSINLDELKAKYHIVDLTGRYINNPDYNFQWHKKDIRFLYDFFTEREFEEELLYDVSKFFILLKQYDLAFSILEKIYLHGTTNSEIIRHYLVLATNKSFAGFSKIYQNLVETQDILISEEWCKMLYDRPSMNYRLLELELFRDLFFLNCGCID